jgi:hypothetical protein
MLGLSRAVKRRLEAQRSAQRCDEANLALSSWGLHLVDEPFKDPEKLDYPFRLRQDGQRNARPPGNLVGWNRDAANGIELPKEF